MLLDITAKITGVSVEELKGKSRLQHISEARYIAFYILREHGYSFAGAGKELNRHHSTVMYGCAEVKGHIESNAFYRSREIKSKVDRILHVIKQTQKQADEQLAAVSAIRRTLDYTNV